MTALATDFRSTLSAHGRRLTLRLARSWAHLHPDNLDASFAAWLASAVPLTATVQHSAAQLGLSYVMDTVQATGEKTRPAPIDPRAFAGHTAAGAPLGSVYSIVGLIDIKQRIAAGDKPSMALQASFVRVARLAQTEVADAGRGATQAAMTLDEHVTGYVRQVRGAACSRCMVLAGKEYSVSDGFRRHPRCHCVHVPVVDGRQPRSQDPMALFNRLAPAEQERVFGAAGATAIRQGADLSSVVNIDNRAGMLVAGGRATLQGTTRRSLAGERLAEVGGLERKPGSRYRSAHAPRLTPQALLEFYGHDRDRYIAALWRNGYILHRTPEVVAALERTAA